MFTVVDDGDDDNMTCLISEIVTVVVVDDDHVVCRESKILALNSENFYSNEMKKNECYVNKINKKQARNMRMIA